MLRLTRWKCKVASSLPPRAIFRAYKHFIWQACLLEFLSLFTFQNTYTNFYGQILKQTIVGISRGVNFFLQDPDLALNLQESWNICKFHIGEMEKKRKRSNQRFDKSSRTFVRGFNLSLSAGFMGTREKYQVCIMHKFQVRQWRGFAIAPTTACLAFAAAITGPGELHPLIKFDKIRSQSSVRGSRTWHILNSYINTRCLFHVLKFSVHAYKVYMRVAEGFAFQSSTWKIILLRSQLSNKEADVTSIRNSSVSKRVVGTASKVQRLFPFCMYFPLFSRINDAICRRRQNVVEILEKSRVQSTCFLS